MTPGRWLLRVGSALLALSAAAGLAGGCAENALERSERLRREQQIRGQSGSEVTERPGAGVDFAGCPCGAYASFIALRVTLLDRRSAPSVTTHYPHCEPNPPYPNPYEEGVAVACERVSLRVEEVLRGNAPLQPGDEIEADSDGYLPCFRGLAGVANGTQALALARWEPPPFPACDARQACLDECAWNAEIQLYAGVEYADDERPCHPDAGPVPEGCRLPEYWCRGTCDEGFDDVCAPRPEPSAAELRERWSVRLAPWDESIVFAQVGDAKLSVPASDLSLLWQDGTQCVERVGNWSDLLEASPGDVSGI